MKWAGGIEIDVRDGMVAAINQHYKRIDRDNYLLQEAFYFKGRSMPISKNILFRVQGALFYSNNITVRYE